MQKKDYEKFDNNLCSCFVHKDKDKDKEALFNVAYNVTDNISS